MAIEPEGPQRDGPANDVATALQANPEARLFLDSLAEFYRRAYLRWIDAMKRRPGQPAEPMMVELLNAGGQATSLTDCPMGLAAGRAR